MSFLKSLPPDIVLLDVFKAFPTAATSLISYHETLLRGPSPLSVGERELIAAYVSSLNACDFCAGVHAAVARMFDIDESLLTDLTENIESSSIDLRLNPIFHFVRKLTKTPSLVTQEDADAILQAGWDDQALHDIVAVCALFNFMNRFVDGLGVRADDDYFQRASERLSHGGYAGLKEHLE